MVDVWWSGADLGRLEIAMTIFPRERARNALLNELSLLKSGGEPKRRKRRNLVVGLAANYGIDDVRNFVVSFRAHNEYDDIVLILTSIDGETKAFLDKYAVTPAVSYGSLFSYLHMQSSRHVVYYDFLVNDLKYQKYDRVFLTDVRDVIFQGNLFQEIPQDRISFFLEDHRTSIGQCRWNSEWIRTGFGEEMLAALGGNPISCSGTVLGKSEAVMEYLLQMLLHYTALNAEGLDMKGIDQGVHNVIVYKSLLEGQRLLENGNGILTLGNILGDHSTFVAQEGFSATLGLDPVFLDQEGRFIFNMKNFSVIHQYDRNPQLFGAVSAFYANPR